MENQDTNSHLDNMVLKKLQDGNTSIAIVGASNNSEKFGNQIYKDLRSKGFKVFPINPKEEFIEGDKAYSSLSELPNNESIVNFVVPPKVALSIAKEAFQLGFQYLWFQPGSESKELKDWLSTLENIHSLTDSCIMVQALN